MFGEFEPGQEAELGKIKPFFESLRTAAPAAVSGGGCGSAAQVGVWPSGFISSGSGRWRSEVREPLRAAGLPRARREGGDSGPWGSLIPSEAALPWSFITGASRHPRLGMGGHDAPPLAAAYPLCVNFSRAPGASVEALTSPPQALQAGSRAAGAAVTPWPCRRPSVSSRTGTLLA